MKQVELRGTQMQCVQALREGIKSGHRAQVLYGPTGFGKTEVAVYMAQGAIAKGRRVVFLVDMNNLVHQASSRYDLYGVDHGIIQASNTIGDYKNCLVVSVQTAESRGWPDDIGVLFVDECHIMRQSVIKLIKERPEMIVVGLSATPFAKGMGEVYSNLVSKTTTNQLIKDGFLAPLRYYAAVSPDMAGAKVVGGEWSASAVEERGTQILGNIVTEWESKVHEIFGGPVKTMGYCASVDHGEALCRQFADSGYLFRLISYRDGNDDARREIMEEFRRPDSEIVGLFSCEALTRGTDIPDVKVGIGARPYRKSFSQHIQQIGRIMRVAPNKSFGVWIDHAGNCQRFWQEQQILFAHGVRLLKDDGKDKVKKEPSEKEKAERCCAKCSAMLPARVNVCPACGHEIQSRTLVEQGAGVVVEIDGEQVTLQPYLHDRDAVWAQLCSLAIVRNKSGDAAQKWCQAQFRNLYGSFARKQFAKTTPEQPSLELRGKIKSMMIRYAKRRRK